MKKFLLFLLVLTAGVRFATAEKEDGERYQLPEIGKTIEGVEFMQEVADELDIQKEAFVKELIGRKMHVVMEVQHIDIDENRGCYAIYFDRFTLYTTNSNLIRFIKIGDFLDVTGKVHVDTKIASSGKIYVYIYPAKVKWLNPNAVKNMKKNKKFVESNRKGRF